ncbi:hypothetical protein [Limnohabitans sp.]|uniref:hypothetical protein n=1 Tax=Limnohabitans sp. TaxID=1907725 RepID=UPI00286F6AE5|nr:hypothetical protein [Limnohabitans sp.]
MSKSSQNLKAALRQSGYVDTAPSCGDCGRASDEPQGTFCMVHLVLVDDGARCIHWMPSNSWMRANPDVVHLYASDALSPAELAYADKAHALPKPASRG